MSQIWSKDLRFKKVFRQVIAATLGLLLASPALAEGNSPWVNAVNVLQQAFTSTARELSPVAIVVSGLTFAFGEGDTRRVLAAVNFLAGLFLRGELQAKPSDESAAWQMAGE